MSVATESPMPHFKADRLTQSVSPAKRKRDFEDGDDANAKKPLNGDGPRRIPEDNSSRVQLALKDVLVVLERHDTRPSILHHKIHMEGGDYSIAGRVSSGVYMSPTEMTADFDLAAASLLDPGVESKKVNGTSIDQERPEVGKERLQAQCTEFKNVASSLISRDRRLAVDETKGTLVNGTTDKKQNNVKVEDVPGQTEAKKDGQAVLTMLGNAPQPRQLFSSFSVPSLVGRQFSTKDAESLDESRLPNGITLAEILSSEETNASIKTSLAPTMGNIFAPPTSLAQLNPPNPPKFTTTRGSAVDWFHPTDAYTANHDQSLKTYYSQPQSTGQSLQYNAVPQIEQQSSPDAKRKQRERALSTGDTSSAVPKEMLFAHSKAKEDALFKRVFSSFAPSRDDSTVLVPEGIKNRVWFDRKMRNSVGSSIRAQELEVAAESAANGDTAAAIEDSSLEDAVNSWTPDTDLNGTTSFKNSENSNAELEDVLEEISDLLETLDSYNRVRNFSLTSGARSSVPQSSPIPDMAGTPSNPSAVEQTVYEMLRSQLQLMISALPPYVVSKLNGDRLADLNITNRIESKTAVYKGIMEEDEASAKAKAAATGMAAGSSLTPQGGQYGPQHYSSRGSGHGQSQPGSRPPPGQYFSPHHIPARPNSSSHARPSGPTPHNYLSQRPPSNSSYHTPYAQHPPRGGQAPQNPSQYLPNASKTPQYGYGQQYQSPAPGGQQTPQTSYNSRPSQPQYQQSAQRRHQAPSYPQNSYATPTGYGGSPQRQPASLHYATQGQQSPQPHSAQQPGRMGSPYGQSPAAVGSPPIPRSYNAT